MKKVGSVFVVAGVFLSFTLNSVGFVLDAGTIAALDQTLDSGVAVATLDQGSSAGATSPPLENSSGGGENRTGERAALLANVA
ncbi:MAG: hypothetical protein LBI70_00880, partial [Rickettsiales bacterium]|nr:hypothetical protein [Rickettsiales bacterium]